MAKGSITIHEAAGSDWWQTFLAVRSQEALAGGKSGDGPVARILLREALAFRVSQGKPFLDKDAPFPEQSAALQPIVARGTRHRRTPSGERERFASVAAKKTHS
ncbi:MAG: hypothetical protein ABI968_15820 [Acidobacteriota bacterium]